MFPKRKHLEAWWPEILVNKEGDTVADVALEHGVAWRDEMDAGEAEIKAIQGPEDCLGKFHLYSNSR